MGNIMDEYLKPNSSFLRLLKEYNEHKSLVIAYDFDNTVYDFHKKGETYNDVVDLIRQLSKAGCYMICFTANKDWDLINNYLLLNDIPFDAINENPPFFNCDERKIYFNALLDDRAGLIQVYSELSLLLQVIEANKNTFYRVCNAKTKQGLWYDENGKFTGLIHDKFSFCHNNNLLMDYDEELKGYLSATKTLEDLFTWFSKEDILNLQEHNYFIYQYQSDDFKFYEKFNHLVINQSKSKIIKKIVL